MEYLNHLVSEINSVLWGVFFLVPLLCGTGIFYTIKLRFVQIRKFGLAARYLFGGAVIYSRIFCIGVQLIQPFLYYGHRLHLVSCNPNTRWREFIWNVLDPHDKGHPGVPCFF